MWQTRMETVRDSGVVRYVIGRHSKTLSYGDVISLWLRDAAFRSHFVDLLTESPFLAYRWETPSVTAGTLDRDFEFVLLSSDALVRRVDAAAFADHFSDESLVATFRNLGNNAVLVAPCPIAEPGVYGHLASFLRNAPSDQIHQHWQAVAVAMDNRISERPVWLSTAGMGVSWLHVRMDDRPKYYGYAPYKQC